MSVVSGIQEKKALFRAKMAEEIGVEQGICPHAEVGHWSGEGITLMYPHRICLNCGLEEEGGWWCYSLYCSHWHPKESVKDGKFLKAVLGPEEGRRFKPLSFDELMQARP